jgi:hypothetical protein
MAANSLIVYSGAESSRKSLYYPHDDEMLSLNRSFLLSEPGADRGPQRGRRAGVVVARVSTQVREPGRYSSRF